METRPQSVSGTPDSTQGSGCLKTTHDSTPIQLLTTTLRTELTGCEVMGEAAAGDPQVVRVLLCGQWADVHVPEAEVSLAAASHKDLTAGREAARRHAGLAHGAAPVGENGPSEPDGNIRIITTNHFWILVVSSENPSTPRVSPALQVHRKTLCAVR